MTKTRLMLGILAAGAVSLLAEDKAAERDAWKKPISEWTVDDAHQIMTDSPWVKTLTPEMEAPTSQRRGGGSGRPGGGGA